MPLSSPSRQQMWTSRTVTAFASLERLILMVRATPSFFMRAECPLNFLSSSYLADPRTGERTIGVLTKVDLMDKGTDCFDILQGRIYPLKSDISSPALPNSSPLVFSISAEPKLSSFAHFGRLWRRYRPFSSQLTAPLGWALSQS